MLLICTSSKERGHTTTMLWKLPTGRLEALLERIWAVVGLAWLQNWSYSASVRDNCLSQQSTWSNHLLCMLCIQCLNTWHGSQNFRFLKAAYRSSSLEQFSVGLPCKRYSWPAQVRNQATLAKAQHQMRTANEEARRQSATCSGNCPQCLVRL